MRWRRNMLRWLVVAAVLLALLAVGFDRLVLPGLSSARRPPPAIESAVAGWLLRASVPAADAARRNPLPADEADLGAGAALFRQDCAVCHGYDGGGGTRIGHGEYPRVPALRPLLADGLSDGAIFYHIRHGIRNTGMPAWDLPDRTIWQLVLFIRYLPIVAPMQPEAAGSVAGAHYVGSAACASCHREIFDRWRTSRMANVVRDPRTHPDAIIPDLNKPDPLVSFGKDDIAFVYGSRFKQRYFKKVGDDFFVLPAQWDVTHHVWRKFFVPNTADWWAPLYPPDNFQRPTGPLCDGCHSVNYDITTKSVTEWNVGCERCHGPGSAHVATPTRATIINPARLDYVDANDTCIQCHSQGRPPQNPIGGKYYDWPVGFEMGKRLSQFWTLEEHRLGETSFTHFPDGTAHKNRMQGNDFVQSLMYARGVACFSCHDPHGNGNVAMLRETGNGLCLTCHGANTQNGPHAPTIAAHTHHKPGSPGSACVACHMPAIEQTLGDVMVHAHTFRFVAPAATGTMQIPNACTLCHTDKGIAWARAALDGWADRSPWRDAP
ncbi:MAG: c-type cytochrome [Rhodospirillales bacterium]|nr:c-type cytochrome [Rhodospirillales bacterium]